MPHILSIVGRSDSGKTTLIEKLIPELARRGYRIATVKHQACGFEVDREGKNSWRHASAGACAVVLSSPHKIALIKTLEKEMGLGEIASRFLFEYDLILAEGYKEEPWPKIEVVCGTPLRTEGEVLAYVTETTHDSCVPEFTFKDIQKIADLIEKELLQCG